MDITEVRIKLMEDSDDRLQAFCSVTFDDSFVIRDLKIIEGSNGPFVAMPSRKLTSHCTRCRSKNHLRASYCNQCGERLKEDRALRDSEGRTKLYADIAHPINSECREMIQKRVILEYQSELDCSQKPDYVSRYDDAYDELLDIDEPVISSEPAATEGGVPPSKSEPVKSEPAKTEKTHVEPAETVPRAPHRTPVPHKSSPHKPSAHKKESSTENKTDEDFGAGIL